MPLLISKYKLFLYLFFFIFLSSILNLKLLENLREQFILKKININGLSIDELNLVRSELSEFQNINIFKLNKDKVLKKLKKFNFLDEIYVNKIIPSSIEINLSKTSIVGKTFKNGKYFYIGDNGKFINSSQIFEIIETPTIFGDFEIYEYLKVQNILKDYQIDFNRIEKYYYYKNKRWDLSFSNGKKLMLPSKNIDKSISIFKKLLINGNLNNIKIVDLRIPNQIILTNNNE